MKKFLMSTALFICMGFSFLFAKKGTCTVEENGVEVTKQEGDIKTDKKGTEQICVPKDKMKVGSEWVKKTGNFGDRFYCEDRLKFSKDLGLQCPSGQLCFDNTFEQRRNWGRSRCLVPTINNADALDCSVRKQLNLGCPVGYVCVPPSTKRPLGDPGFSSNDKSACEKVKK